MTGFNKFKVFLLPKVINFTKVFLINVKKCDSVASRPTLIGNPFLSTDKMINDSVL